MTRKLGLLGLVTESDEAAALGGVGPRPARSPEAADRWLLVAPCMVTHDRGSAGRSYAAVRPFPPGHA